MSRAKSPVEMSDYAFRRPDLKAQVRPEFVYFARARRSGLIKIGFSVDPEKRMSGIKSAAGDEIMILFTVPGGRDVEREFHRKFSGHHEKGEWFRETGSLGKFIQQKCYVKASRKQPEQHRPKSPSTQLLTPEHLEKYPSARLMGYARVSTEEQSIDMQVTRLLEFGVKPADPKSDYLGDLYCDTISASSAKRPWFNLLLKQIWPGDFIIVYSLSRLHRDAGDQLAFFKWAKSQDIKIISLTESVDLDTTSGKAMASMIAVFAEIERNTLIERTRHGMQERIRQGVMMGRPTLVTEDVAAEMNVLRHEKRWPVSRIAEKFDVSKSAVYAAT